MVKKCKIWGCLTQFDASSGESYCPKCLGIINKDMPLNNVTEVEIPISNSHIGKCSICCCHAMEIKMSDSSEMQKLFGKNEFCSNCELKMVNFLLDIRTARTE